MSKLEKEGQRRLVDEKAGQSVKAFLSISEIKQSISYIL